AAGSGRRRRRLPLPPRAHRRGGLRRLVAAAARPASPSSRRSAARADGRGADPSGRAGELAFHLDRAGDREAAFVASLAAADAAETVAPAAAFGHLERALKLWDSAGERATQARRSD